MEYIECRLLYLDDIIFLDDIICKYMNIYSKYFKFGGQTTTFKLNINYFPCCLYIQVNVVNHERGKSSGVLILILFSAYLKLNMELL